MKNFKKSIIIIIFIFLIIIFIIYNNFFYEDFEDYKEDELYENITNQSLEDENKNEIIKNEVYEESNNIIIHITGEVTKQGIITIKEGSRIADAIEAAGGTTQNADLNSINLAFVLSDGQKIYVPSIYDEKDIVYVTKEAGENVIDSFQTKQEKKININTATQTELESLTGIGPSTAIKIINYRKENGNFKKIEELKNIPGIGESKFQIIKDEICV